MIGSNIATLNLPSSSQASSDGEAQADPQGGDGAISTAPALAFTLIEDDAAPTDLLASLEPPQNAEEPAVGMPAVGPATPQMPAAATAAFAMPVDESGRSPAPLPEVRLPGAGWWSAGDLAEASPPKTPLALTGQVSSGNPSAGQFDSRTPAPGAPPGGAGTPAAPPAGAPTAPVPNDVPGTATSLRLSAPAGEPVIESAPTHPPAVQGKSAPVAPAPTLMPATPVIGSTAAETAGQHDVRPDVRPVSTAEVLTSQARQDPPLVTSPQAPTETGSTMIAPAQPGRGLPAAVLDTKNEDTRLSPLLDVAGEPVRPGVRQTRDDGGSTASVQGSRPIASAVADQIGFALSRLSGDKIEVLLEPRELGRVSMTVTASADTVTVQVTPERAETSDLMRRHVELLQRELSNAGFRGVTIDISSGQGQGQKAEQQGTAPEPSGQSRDTPEDTRQVGSINNGPPGGLDIKL
ncbi:MAG: flagellar hook-length control protein FliK [Pseudomonadota bacterium]